MECENFNLKSRGLDSCEMYSKIGLSDHCNNKAIHVRAHNYGSVAKGCQTGPYYQRCIIYSSLLVLNLPPSIRLPQGYISVAVRRVEPVELHYRDREIPTRDKYLRA